MFPHHLKREECYYRSLLFPPQGTLWVITLHQIPKTITVFSRDWSLGCWEAASGLERQSSSFCVLGRVPAEGSICFAILSRDASFRLGAFSAHSGPSQVSDAATQPGRVSILHQQALAISWQLLDRGSSNTSHMQSKHSK